MADKVSKKIENINKALETIFNDPELLEELLGYSTPEEFYKFCSSVHGGYAQEDLDEYIDNIMVILENKDLFSAVKEQDLLNVSGGVNSKKFNKMVAFALASLTMAGPVTPIASTAYGTGGVAVAASPESRGILQKKPALAPRKSFWQKYKKKIIKGGIYIGTAILAIIALWTGQKKGWWDLSFLNPARWFGGGQPQQPQAGQPGQPQAGQPGQPQAGQPGQPQAGQPGQPQAGQPGQPQPQPQPPQLNPQQQQALNFLQQLGQMINPQGAAPGGAPAAPGGAGAVPAAPAAAQGAQNNQPGWFERHAWLAWIPAVWGIGSNMLDTVSKKLEKAGRPSKAISQISSAWWSLSRFWESANSYRKQVMNEWTNVPVDLHESIDNLDYLFEEIKGQEKAKKEVQAIVFDILQRKKQAEITGQKYQRGDVLYFYGPSRTGKSMMGEGLAKYKILSNYDEVYKISASEIDTGSNKETKLEQLFGTASYGGGYYGSYGSGYGMGGGDSAQPRSLVKYIKEHPNGIILIDEYDKMWSAELDEVFRTIVDNGVIRVRGQTIDCSGMTFILTSNESSAAMSGNQKTVSSKDDDGTGSRTYNVKHDKSFINRIRPVEFENLSVKDYEEIAKKEFTKLCIDFWRHPEIGGPEVVISDEVYQKIAKAVEKKNQGASTVFTLESDLSTLIQLEVYAKTIECKEKGIDVRDYYKNKRLYVDFDLEDETFDLREEEFTPPPAENDDTSSEETQDAKDEEKDETGEGIKKEENKDIDAAKSDTESKGNPLEVQENKDNIGGEKKGIEEAPVETFKTENNVNEKDKAKEIQDIIQNNKPAEAPKRIEPAIPADKIPPATVDAGRGRASDINDKVVESRSFNKVTQKAVAEKKKQPQQKKAPVKVNPAKHVVKKKRVK